MRLFAGFITVFAITITCFTAYSHDDAAPHMHEQFSGKEITLDDVKNEEITKQEFKKGGPQEVIKEFLFTLYQGDMKKIMTLFSPRKKMLHELQPQTLDEWLTPWRKCKTVKIGELAHQGISSHDGYLQQTYKMDVICKKNILPFGMTTGQIDGKWYIDDQNYFVGE